MFGSNTCQNGIVGLFCQGYGCYYNSDCFDGYCNMYSKCERRERPSYMDNKGNVNSVLPDTDASTQTDKKETITEEISDQKDLTTSKADLNQTQAPSFTTPIHAVPSQQYTAKELKKDHFSESPFADSNQLNKFLMWFGILSALLIMAFMVQCCREIARGDDLPVNLSHQGSKSN